MSDRAALIPLVGRLAKARVCVIGDVMLDRFVSGSVERISPEAPIPVLRVDAETAMLGGAGNVVRSLSGLGGRATLIAAVGDDDAGRAVRAHCDTVPALSAKLTTDPTRRTGIKTRFVAGPQQLMRADDETVGPLSPAAAAKVDGAVRAAVKRAGAVALSDYGKGVLSDDAIRAAVDAAADAGVPVVVDPKGTDFSCYVGADLITPNRAELAAASGLPTATDAEVVAAARAVMRTCGVKAVLATRSQDGMTLVTTLRGKAGVVHLPAERREVFDVSGAGDTVVAAVALALAAGAPLAEAAALANVAAGIAVGKVGTAAVYAEEVVDALRHQDLSDAEAKVLGLERVVEQTALWRRQGKRVGFTNGCFDLLHPGHVSLLAQARAACDRLIVGLNSDASVKRLKGRDRPVQNEAARAAVLASLGTVDCVTVFEDDTPLALIEAVRPDVLVKGADYAKKDVVGGAFVEKHGGRVVLATLEDGHSTTGTIARLAKGKTKSAAKSKESGR
jgi:D-beta-D-heptose 7-phosphate kinase/D-beta-D-heptose 1-phosphate adenosyltransferase